MGQAHRDDTRIELSGPGQHELTDEDGMVEEGIQQHQERKSEVQRSIDTAVVPAYRKPCRAKVSRRNALVAYIAC